MTGRILGRLAIVALALAGFGCGGPEESQAQAPAPEKKAPEERKLGRGYFGSREDYQHGRFLTTVDVIEELTGLDFKPSTDAVVERRIERQRPAALWDPPVVDRKLRRVFLSGCRR